MTYMDFMNEPLLHPQAETLERLRLTSRISHQEWFEVLGLRWPDYQKFKSGEFEIPETSLQNLAQRFSLCPERLRDGHVDFADLALASDASSRSLPERYSRAAYGRRRTSLNSIDFLDKNFGWRVRLDVVERFELPESELRDPFAPISVQFMTDLCAYLQRRNFYPDDFFAMGAYTFEASQNTILSRLLSEMRSQTELYEFFVNEAMKMFEQNCTYRLLRLTSKNAIIEVRSNTDVASELGVRHIGSETLCTVKAGMAACLPRFLGLSMAKVHKTACVHLGDDACRYDVNLQESACH